MNKLLSLFMLTQPQFRVFLNPTQNSQVNQALPVQPLDPLMLMLMLGGGGSMSSMLPLLLMSGNQQIDPMIMMLMMNGGGSSNMLMMMMMMGMLGNTGQVPPNNGGQLLNMGALTAGKNTINPQSVMMWSLMPKMASGAGILLGGISGMIGQMIKRGGTRRRYSGRRTYFARRRTTYRARRSRYYRPSYRWTR